MTATSDLFHDTLGRAWPLVMLRGVAGVAFGALALIWPGLTLISLIVVFGVYALVDGVLALIAAVRGGGLAPRWWMALIGLAGLVAGAIALAWPGLTVLAFIILLGAAAIIRGMFEIIGAIQLRKTIANEWMLILSGAISVLFGLAIIASPGVGALALTWLIGFWAVLFGALSILLSLRLKKLKDGETSSTAAPES